MMLNEKKPMQLVPETAAVDIHDRVTEAYYGRMGQQFMWDTQNRIHWICRQVQGKSVLDVGCSQGIVPILLAREGLKVIGIDSSPKSIDEANHYLADESEQVRRNVSFINTDFLSWDPDDLKIGTIVMSEMLEHLTRPDTFLDMAARILAKKGRLIVTVPFGINDFIDHKHTFYLLNPLRLISKQFEVVDIEVLGKWLGIVADRRAGSNRGLETFQPTTALMEKLESAFYQTERVLRDELSLTKKSLDEANQKYRGATEQLNTLKQRTTEEESARRTAEQALQETTAQLKRTQSSLQEESTTLQQQVAQWSLQAQTSGAAAQEAEKHGLRLKAELDAAQEKYTTAIEQITALKQRMTEEVVARQVAEQSLAHTSALLEETQRFLQEERNALQQQYIQWSQQAQTSGAAAQEVEKYRLRLEAEVAGLQSRLDTANQKYKASTEQVSAQKNELATLHSRLDETNQKYRNATEQVTALKQRITQEEAARKAAEQALSSNATAQKAELAAVRNQLEETNQKYRLATEQVTTQKAELLAVQNRLDEANQKYRLATEQVTTQKAELAAVRSQLGETNEKYRAATEQVAAQKADLDTLRGRLDEANEKYGAASEQITTLKERARQEEAARKAAEQETQRRLQEECTALQQQLAHWIAEGQAKMVAVHEAEKKLIRLEAELATVQSRLDEANQKYRGATEQVASQKIEMETVHSRLNEANEKYRGVTEQVTALKQRTTEQEAARKAVEQSLAQSSTQLEQTQRRFQEERTILEQQLNQSIAEGQAKTLAVHEMEKKLIRLEAELTTVQNRLNDANQKYRGASEQVTAQKGELSAVQSRLDAANQKYRDVTEQITALKERTTQEVAARKAAEQTLQETTNKLDQAKSKYREVTAKQIPELKNKLETKETKVREGQHALEQLRIQLRNDRKTLAETTRQLERTRQQAITAKNQLIKTRETISFRFGYLLTHGFKSVGAFANLPSALWALRKDAIQRRNKPSFVPSPPKLTLPPEPSLIVSASEAVTEPLSQEPPSNGHVISAEATVARTAPTGRPALASTPIQKLHIACIMDEFTFGSFQPESILHQLTPGNWKAELEGATPDLLFIESAWRGKDELWGNKVGHTSVELQSIVTWCRARKIPTVFWCKEDPIHFETFLNTAKLFDYVFTTDIDCIHRYKAALGHGRVYLLPFACQPAAHNPIETYQRKDAFCFAGAYYVRYPERTRDLSDFVIELPAFRPLEIYDRNYGKKDPNYQFPTEYQQYIVGTLPFDQIDKAYKGYRYAINLNSMKQSQSMFARRVFELLACNTITISNFSRGLRLLFGDLVIASDSGSEVVRRLNKVAGNDEHSRKLRLAALRKVMNEHTYGQRLAYVVSKVSGEAIEQSLPHIAVLAYAGSRTELDIIQENYRRQCYANTSLYIVLGDGVTPPMTVNARMQFLKLEEVKDMTVDKLDNKADLMAGMIAEDYYGPNYLQDIALATRYTRAEVIGKAARYTYEGGGFQLKQSDGAYHPVQCLPARAAAIRRYVIAKEKVLEWVTSLRTGQLQADRGLAIDEFSYCEQGSGVDSAMVREKVDDLPDLNTGISIEELLKIAERIAPERTHHDDCPKLTGEQLAGDFGKKPSDTITLTVDGKSWRIDSTLRDGTHEYLYATKDHSLDELGFTDQLKVYLDVTPGLNIQLVIQFLDTRKQKISHIIHHANRNQEAAIPAGTDRIRFGLRFYSGGSAEIKNLVLGHRNLQPAEMICKAEHLLLTNHYPTYSELYRNGFVHTRVRAYQSRGLPCDVFRLRPDETVSYHEFEDVNVITASQEVLHQMLSSGRYKTILVHFLDQAMWDVLRYHVERIKVLVWVHGAEIRRWDRRYFDDQTEEQCAVAQRKSDQRTAFWRELLQPVPANLKLVFVSRSSAEEAMKELGFRIPEKHYCVIHNPIETDLFSYVPKGIDQRKKVLSIRPYASKIYANDLSVKAIQLLSEQPWFNDMEFRMIGDGPSFEETIAPLRKYKNVYIEQRFLRRDEIASLHKRYGIFLCPTRMDTQGVSRDEAMASGLVPVTNAVSAIPEFVDASCGILAPEEDADAIAKGILLLYEQPLKFSEMSEAASKRVRRQSNAQRITRDELALILGDSEQTG